MAKKTPKKKDRIWPQYAGPVTIKQLAEGSNLAIRNAVRLLKDARALLAAGRYPSAAYLAIIAIEEYGKLPILDDMASASSEELNSKWRAYRSHTSKNARWILPALADSGPKSIEQFAGALNPESGHQQFLDEMKQLSLYTDCLSSGDWSDPADFMKQQTAQGLIETADRLINGKPVTEDDVALRADYMRKIQSAGSTEEKKHIIGDYLREAGFTASGIKDLLSGTLDLKGAGRKD